MDGFVDCRGRGLFAFCWVGFSPGGFEYFGGMVCVEELRTASSGR